MQPDNINDVINHPFPAQASSEISGIFMLERVPVYLVLSTDPWAQYVNALTYAPSAQARFYIYMRTVNMLFDSRAFQLRGFTSFQSLSCSFSKNGKALQPELEKTENVICRGNVGRHLG